MTETDRTDRNKRRIPLSYIPIGLLIILLAAFIFYRVNSRSRLEAKLDEIRAAGYPATLEELDKWYSIPDGVPNAADVILDAVSY